MTGHFKKTIGSRAEVFHGTAEKTQYGKTKSKGGQSLEKKDLIRHNGRIVSLELHMKGKVLLKRLNNAGYFAKKGKFGSEYKPNKDKKGKSGKSTTKKHRAKHKKRTNKRHKKRKHGTKKKKYRRVVIREKRSRKSGRFMGGRK
tara:strand:- start:1440 stop:1871 length:432 start_codon:yes stop_codon:yes gene_type:complete